MHAAPGADGRAADEDEGHVRAQFGSQWLQVLAAQAQAPEGGAGEQRAGCVGGPAGHAPGDGDALANGQRGAQVVAADVPGQELGGTDGEVGVVHGQERRALTVEDELELAGASLIGDDLVTQGNGLEHGAQLVKALGIGPTDPQGEIYLRGHAHPHRVAHGFEPTPEVARRCAQMP